MSLNDMVMISAAEKFSSLASRLAAALCTVGSNLVVLHQTKIPGLQAAVVLQGKPFQILDTHLGQ